MGTQEFRGKPFVYEVAQLGYGYFRVQTDFEDVEVKVSEQIVTCLLNEAISSGRLVLVDKKVWSHLEWEKKATPTLISVTAEDARGNPLQVTRVEETGGFKVKF